MNLRLASITRRAVRQMRSVRALFGLCQGLELKSETYTRATTLGMNNGAVDR